MKTKSKLLRLQFTENLKFKIQTIFIHTYLQHTNDMTDNGTIDTIMKDEIHLTLNINIS